MADTQHRLSYIEGDSVMHHLYPLTKLIWVFVVAAGLFFYQTPVTGGIMFLVVTLMAVVISRIPFSTLIGSAKLIFGLGIILMIFHFFADPGNPVYSLGPLTITDNGLREGPIQGIPHGGDATLAEQLAARRDLHRDNPHSFPVGQREEFLSKGKEVWVSRIQRHQNCVEVKRIDAANQHVGIEVAGYSQEPHDSLFLGLLQRFDSTVLAEDLVQLFILGDVM